MVDEGLLKAINSMNEKLAQDKKNYLSKHHKPSKKNTGDTENKVQNEVADASPAENIIPLGQELHLKPDIVEMHSNPEAGNQDFIDELGKFLSLSSTAAEKAGLILPMFIFIERKGNNFDISLDGNAIKKILSGNAGDDVVFMSKDAFNMVNGLVHALLEQKNKISEPI
jgi:hypothetical protein